MLKPFRRNAANVRHGYNQKQGRRNYAQPLRPTRNPYWYCHCWNSDDKATKTIYYSTIVHCVSPFWTLILQGAHVPFACPTVSFRPHQKTHATWPIGRPAPQLRFPRLDQTCSSSPQSAKPRQLSQHLRSSPGRWIAPCWCHIGHSRPLWHLLRTKELAGS